MNSRIRTAAIRAIREATGLSLYEAASLLKSKHKTVNGYIDSEGWVYSVTEDGAHYRWTADGWALFASPLPPLIVEDEG